MYGCKTFPSQHWRCSCSTAGESTEARHNQQRRGAATRSLKPCRATAGTASGDGHGHLARALAIAAVPLALGTGSGKRGSWRYPSLRRVARRSKALIESEAGDATGGDEQQQTEVLRPTLGTRSEMVRANFKTFLLQTEEESPLWYRLSDLYLTMLGAFCFYAEVLEPKFSARYHLGEIEDIVNVNFFLKFLLLFWANDFSINWLFTPKACLDLGSCLPIISVLETLMVGTRPTSAFNLLQLSRFLRLLRESLPSGQRAQRAEARDEDDPLVKKDLVRERNRGALQTLTLFLAVGGSVAVSATLLCLYEGPAIGSFEDAVLYMVTVFAGRETPFRVTTAGAKQVTVAAVLLSLVFVPFLISESFLVFTGNDSMRNFSNLGGGGGGGPAAALPGVPSQSQAEGVVLEPVKETESDSPRYWARAISRLDALQDAGLISADEGRELRKRFLTEDKQALILDQCYAKNWVDLPPIIGAETDEWRRYAQRLREWIEDRSAD